MDLDQRLADPYRGNVEIHTRPRQAEQLTAPQAIVAFEPVEADPSKPGANVAGRPLVLQLGLRRHVDLARHPALGADTSQIRRYEPRS